MLMDYRRYASKSSHAELCTSYVLTKLHLLSVFYIKPLFELPHNWLSTTYKIKSFQCLPTRSIPCLTACIHGLPL